MKYKIIELTYLQKGTFQGGDEDCAEQDFIRDKDYIFVEKSAADKLAIVLENVIKYKWQGFGPGGCDTHCITHPCGPCMFDTSLQGYVKNALKKFGHIK